jgi:AcrR family transcriptional regulator
LPPDDSTAQPAGGGRAALLDRAVDYFAGHGVGDTSLRALAGAIGTSHRMLIYHFNSREGLLAAVVEQVETRARASLGELTSAVGDSGGGTTAAGLRYWSQIVDEALVYGPLFFELSSHAMQGHPHTAALREQLVAPWLDAFVAALTAVGLEPDAARIQARLNLAVARGLIHDLLLTGDRDGVDAAMRYFAAASGL